MLIEIRKYRYRTDGLKNYFDRPVLADKLILDSVLNEGFPIFNEEFENSFDTFDLTVSDFDLIFSFLQNNITSGRTVTSVENFFKENLDNHCLAIKVNIDGKIIGGLIDIQSIVLDYTLTENRYDVQFTVYSFVRDFVELGRHKPPRPGSFTNYFNGYIAGMHFRTSTNELLPNYLYIDTSNLNWYNRIGYEPVLVNELWFRLYDSGRLNNTTSWELFEDLCMAFGIVYKFVLINPDIDNYFRVAMKLTFRDRGFSNNNIVLDLLTERHGFKIDEQVNQFQFFVHQKSAHYESGEPEGNKLYGTFFDRTRKNTMDGFVYGNSQIGIGEETVFDEEERYFINAPNISFYHTIRPKSAVNKVEYNYYFNTTFQDGFLKDYYLFLQQNNNSIDGFILLGINKVVSFPRMWVKAGYTIPYTNIPQGAFTKRLNFIQSNGTPDIHNIWYSLIENTAFKCYEFLVSKLAKTLFGKVSLVGNSAIEIFDKTNRNGTNYILQKISNLDLKEKTCETEWIEYTN